MHVKKRRGMAAILVIIFFSFHQNKFMKLGQLEIIKKISLALFHPYSIAFVIYSVWYLARSSESGKHTTASYFDLYFQYPESVSDQIPFGFFL